MFHKANILHLIRRNRLPAVVFLVSALLTLGSWQYATHLDKLQAKHRFDQVAQTYQQNLRDRFNTYLRSLVDLRGLFDSGRTISKSEFDAFVHSTDLIQGFPGITRIGYAPLVTAQGMAAFERRAQAQGIPGFRIKAARQESTYIPVFYAVPLTSYMQHHIIGLDLAELPNRWAAMMLARDTNQAVVTKRIALPSDSHHNPAIGIYLPVYRYGTRHDTLDERRSALAGFVFEGFQVGDLLRGVFGQDFTSHIDVKIYDGTQLEPAALLYKSSEAGVPATDSLHAQNIATLKIAHNVWTVVFTSKPGFYPSYRTRTPAVILLSGLLITLLLTGLAAQSNSRRRLAWAKEEQNQQFLSLFVHNPYAVFSLDLQGHFTRVNEASAKLAGLSAEELCGMHFGQLVEWASADIAMFLFEQAKRGIPQQGEVTISHASGKLTQLNVTSLPIIVRGKIIGVFGIAKDITEQKRAEKALHESEACFRAIFEQAPVGINQVDLNNIPVQVNQRLLEITGYSFEELKEKTLLHGLTHPDDLERSLAYDSRIKTGEIDRYSIEKRYIRKDASVVWVHLTKTIIHSVAGKPQFLIAIVEDITEHKQSEVQIRKQQQLLSTIIDTLPLNVFIRNKEEKFVLINKYAAAMLGRSKEDVIGKYLADVFPKDTVARLREQDAKAWGTNAGAMVEESLYQLGTERYFLGGKLPLTLENEPPLLLGYSLDITERKRAEDALQRTNDELEDNVRARTEELNEAYQTLRNLSSHLQIAREEERTRIAREVHDEMGGVLTAIKIDTSLLKQQLETNERNAPAELDRMLQLIDTAVTSLRRIITDLRPSILDTLGLCAALEWQLQEFQNRTGIICSLRMEGAEFDIDDDRATAIFRIFQEALTNVAKHAQATSLNVYGIANDEKIVLKIIDNGIGIPRERRLNAESFGILGMKERARIFNGSVRIAGSPFKGTTVSIQFPLKIEAAG